MNTDLKPITLSTYYNKTNILYLNIYVKNVVLKILTAAM